MGRILGVVAVAVGLLAGCNSEERGHDAVTVGAVPGAEAPREVPEGPAGVQASNGLAVVQAATGIQAGKPSRYKAILPAEQPLIDGAGVSVEKVSRIIRTQDFGTLLDRLRAEAAQDPLAQDATLAQGRMIGRQLGPTVALREFACGLSICAGVVDLGNAPAAYDRFVDAYLSGTGPAGSLLDYRVDLGGGRYQQRFVMSYDPAVNGITFSGAGARN